MHQLLQFSSAVYIVDFLNLSYFIALNVVFIDFKFALYIVIFNLK